MNVKRFVAADMRRALDLVKQELGPDAVILSTNRTKAGVEVITSVAGTNEWNPLDTKVLPNVSLRQLGKKFAGARSNARPQNYDDVETPLHSDGAWAGQSAIGYLMEKQREREARRFTVDSQPSTNQGPANQSHTAYNPFDGGNPNAPTPSVAQYSPELNRAQVRASRERDIAPRPMQHSQYEPVDSLAAAAYRQPPGENATWSDQLPADKVPDVDALQRAGDAVATAIPTMTGPQPATAANDVTNEIDNSTPASTLWNLLKLDNCSFVFTPPTPPFTTTSDPTAQDEEVVPAVEDSTTIESQRIEPKINDVLLLDTDAVDTDVDNAPEWNEISALKSEIADMRELLQTQLERLASTVRPEPRVQIISSVKATISRRLQHLGLPKEERDKLLAQISDTVSLADGWTEVLAIFAHQLPIQGLDIVDKGGFFALIGPSGSGKTTTLSKMAARYVLKHGSRNVAIVTIDSQGIAGQEQLQRLGRILNVPVHVVRDCKHLVYQLDDLNHYSLVLIDTPSQRHGDPQLKEQLRILRNLSQVQSLLVVAANTQVQMLKASIHAYKPAGLIAGILTKLDDTASLGEVLTVVMQENLPVAYTSNGPDITRDLAIGRAHQLVARAVAVLKDESRRQKQLPGGAHKQSIFS